MYIDEERPNELNLELFIRTLIKLIEDREGVKITYKLIKKSDLTEDT